MEPTTPAALASEPIRPLRRSEYARLVAAGAFTGERVELLFGRIVEMRPQNAPHASAIARLTRLLVLSLGQRALVRVQLPLAASDDSEPEPDLAVVDDGDYSDAHPTAARLVVEVSDRSRRRDLLVKPAVYAAMGVQDYWVLDLERGELIVHRDPDGDRYRQVQTLDRRGELAPLAFADVTVRVDAALPPER